MDRRSAPDPVPPPPVVELGRNVYSPRWFHSFLADIDPTIVAPESAFLERQLPPRTHRRILDVCCGPGRHLPALCDSGHAVVGLDRDIAALRRARRTAPRAGFLHGDMRSLPVAREAFDGAICMWQSFGAFSHDQNLYALGELGRVVRPGGRVVLDLYHRSYHAAHLSSRVITRSDARITEQRSMAGHRLTVRLCYERAGEESAVEEFDWELYDPDDIGAVARDAGLAIVTVCAGFDEHRPVSLDEPRMQVVLRPSLR